MLNLNSKNVLLVAPNFFGYANEIKKELELRGAQVSFLEDRPLRRSWAIALGLVFPFLKRLAFLRLCNSFFSNDSLNFDIVLIINGESFSKKLFFDFKRRFAVAKFILYIWDNSRNKPDVFNFIKFYDVVYTFDKGDAEEYGLRFQPLFFKPFFDNNIVAKKSLYDICFVGTVHSDRYFIISKLKEHFPPNFKVFIHLYVQAPWVYWFRKLTNFPYMKSKSSDFIFQPLKKDALTELFLKSRIIIDIEHPKQEGLTFRTIEALGAHKKLITTNPSISSYDFYDASNIEIIDRTSPRVPNSFLYSEYNPVSKDIRDRYKLSSWLDKILEEVNL